MKLGIILPLSGSISFIGDDMRRGIELAAKHAKHVNFELVFEDDKTANRVAAVSAAKKLTSIDKVDVLLNAYVSTVSAIAPTIKQTETPCIVIWDSNESVPGFSKEVIGFGYSNEQAGYDMAEFAFRDQKRKKAAIISFHDEWSELISSSFAKRYNELGGELVLNETISHDSADIKSLLIRAKAAGAGAIYLPLYGSGLHAAIKQSRQLAPEALVLTADAFGSSDIKQTGPAAEGVYVTQIWLNDTEFKERYEQYFGNSSADSVSLGYAALAYDSALLIDAVAGKLQAAGSKPDSTNITAALPGFNFKGVLGGVTITADRTTDRREGILLVKNGGFEVVSRQ